MKAIVTAAAALWHFYVTRKGTGRWGVNRGKAAWRRRRRAQWKMKITLLVTLHQTRVQKQNPKKICAKKGEPEFHRLALV